MSRLILRDALRQQDVFGLDIRGDARLVGFNNFSGLIALGSDRDLGALTLRFSTTTPFITGNTTFLSTARFDDSVTVNSIRVISREGTAQQRIVFEEVGEGRRISEILEFRSDPASNPLDPTGTIIVNENLGGRLNSGAFANSGSVEVFATTADDLFFFNDRELGAINGGAGEDTIVGGVRNDDILGGGGADRLVGRDGNDEIRGGTGADRLNGGAGQDLLLGGGGRDKIRGGAGSDTIKGNFGNDTLIGNGGADRILGGAGNDVINTGRGPDSAIGGKGNDTIVASGLGFEAKGGPGADRIVLLGREFVVGDVTLGPGADVIVFRTRDASVNIEDFTPGQDRVALPLFDSFQDLEFGRGSLNRGETGVIITNGDYLIVFEGINRGELSPGDFIF